MGTVMPLPRPDIQKQSAAPKPISTGAAHHVDKQSGSKKSSQQNVALPVVSKGHAGDVQNVIITTRGNSNRAATKGEPKESTGTERQSQQKSSAPNKKQTGSEKKSHQVSTSQMTPTSGGARGVEKTKDIINPENIATHPFFYGTKFVQLNCSLTCISFSDGKCLYNFEYVY